VALGNVAAGLGDNDTALGAFDTALKLDPGSPAAHVGRGDILAGQGRTEEAITAYKSALKTDERSAPTLVRLAVTEEKAKRPAEAEKSYRAVLAIDPREPIATNNLAFLLAEEKRQLDDALGLATRAVERAPASENALDTLAWVRRARGELPVAAKILEPLAGRTKAPALLYHLGVVYSEMGKKREAILAFDNALKLAPDYQPAREARQKLADSAR
jgi:tetratricopeptide (TPR) repeat protein